MKKYKNGKEIVGVALIVISFLLIIANVLNVLLNDGAIDFGFWLRTASAALTMFAMAILTWSWRRERKK